MQEKEFPYKQPREIAQNLWEVEGEWSNKLGRRMTVVRLADGRVWLHSSIRLRPKDLDWLKSIGTVAFIVAPNVFHVSDAGWMAKAFPAAELFVPKSKMKFFIKQGFNPKDVNTDFPTTIASELKCMPMLGTRIDEAAFLHIPSRTLILCDLAFNMPDVFTGAQRFLAQWNQIVGMFGPSRITKLLFTKNQKKLIDSYKALLKEDFDRVIVNHGNVLESGGKEKLFAGVERIFG